MDEELSAGVDRFIYIWLAANNLYTALAKWLCLLPKEKKEKKKGLPRPIMRPIRIPNIANNTHTLTCHPLVLASTVPVEIEFSGGQVRSSWWARSD